MLRVSLVARALGRKFSSKSPAATKASMEDIVNLCKQRGFIYPSGEIYNSYSGFFDYGPLGTEMKRNIKNEWWKEFVQKREDVVGLDSSIITNPAVWHASGHATGFSDPMVVCRESGMRLRADQVFWATLRAQDGSGEVYVSTLESEDDMENIALQKALRAAKKKGLHGPFEPLSELRNLTQCDNDEEYSRIPSPVGTGLAGVLSTPREFNLMFETRVGAAVDDAARAFLRPETAQGIFTNFTNVQRTTRRRLPFGIAQIGKAFRNEITPRNFIFRSREFEMMEIEYFIEGSNGAWRDHFQNWLRDCKQWLVSLGISGQDLAEDVKGKDGRGLAHYAHACTDITFDFPFGRHELMGIAARGDFDLRNHSASSGQALHYYDSKTDEHFIPHCIEPSIGLDRLVLALLTSAYRVETVRGADGKDAPRVVLALHPRIAPVKVVVMPLMANEKATKLVEKARSLFEQIQSHYHCEYDTAGKIGKRYRRADEVGVPFCITVDFESIDDEKVTVRYRDSMEQIRVHTKDVMQFLSKEIDGV